jgi:hypothetical protein
LHVHLPTEARIRIIRNGQHYQRKDGKIGQFEVEQPGLYRVEIFRNNRAWIFSNHIRISGE